MRFRQEIRNKCRAAAVYSVAVELKLELLVYSAANTQSSSWMNQKESQLYQSVLSWPLHTSTFVTGVEWNSNEWLSGSRNLYPEKWRQTY